MNSSNFKIGLVFLLVSITGLLYAQKKCDYGYLVVPEQFTSYVKGDYLNKINNGVIDLRDLTYKSQRCWIVYSDRNENELYDAPLNEGGRLKHNSLKFMQSLFVKEVKEDWLNVVDKESDENLGWVKAKQLVLSNYAILDNSSIPKKALMLLTISGNKKIKIDKKDFKINYFYDRPVVQNSYRIRDEHGNLRTAAKFRIFYILKETPDMLLLSENDNLAKNQATLDINVKGWAPTVKTTSWDHRICLEPAYGREARRAYDTVWVFHDNLSMFKQFLGEQQVSVYNYKDFIMRKYPITQRRVMAQTMRMPILENYKDDPNIKKVATIASLTSGSEDSLILKLTKQINNEKNIDILFAVDATESMKKYFAPIANSINKIIEKNKRIGTEAHLRFGLVVYRDYADNKEAYEITPLTYDIQSIINKMNTVECKSSPNDHDKPEAMYYGLINGIKEAGFEKNRNNLVVLVGDAGNHERDPRGVTQKDVVDALVKYDIDLVTFQVYRTGDDAYTLFNFQAQDILRSTASRLNNTGVKAHLISDKYNNRQKNTYYIAYGDSREKSIYRMYGKFTYANDSKPMMPDILEKNILFATEEYLSNLKSKIRTLEEIKTGEQGSFTPEVIVYFRNLGYTDEEIEILKDYGEMSMLGFISMSYGDKNIDCFRPVVFLSKDEKQQVNEILNKLNARVGTAKTKANFKNAILTQTKAMLGIVDDEIILDMTIDEIWKIILAVDFTGDRRIAKTKLRMFDQLDDDVFDSFYSNFMRSVARFTSNSYRDSEFELAQQKFYWIPLEDIPGNKK